MIYRHYGNGKLYYNIGFATRFSKDFPAKVIKHVAFARYTEAETHEERKWIDVYSVLDEKTGSMYYAYDTDVIDGLFTFYKDLDGGHWLRPRDMFFEDVDGKPRFEKVSGEELFDTIAEMMSEDYVF